MHRLFAALPVPEEISDRLMALQEDLHGACWRRTDHHHITLQFFGEVDTEVAEEIAAALEALQAPVLSLSLEGVGWFGRKAPHSLYARIAENEALRNLSGECRKLARRLGLKIDTRPFKPHITLAYCRDTPLEHVRTWSETFQQLSSEPFLIDVYHLYESFTGSGRQSRYQAQADYRLGKTVA